MGAGLQRLRRALADPPMQPGYCCKKMPGGIDPVWNIQRVVFAFGWIGLRLVSVTNYNRSATLRTAQGRLPVNVNAVIKFRLAG